MATKNMLIAVIIAAVVVVSVAAFALLRDDGGDRPSQVNAIGEDVEVGDYYILSSSATTSGTALGFYASNASDASADETKYTVTSVDPDTGMLGVEVSSSAGTKSQNMSKDSFLDNVSVVDAAFIGQYQRDDTITYGGQTIRCMIFMDQQSVGGATEVTTYDWIGADTNIIYKTEIVLESSGTTETYRTTLVNTNMIGSTSSDSVNIPQTPVQSGGIRTELQVGDYIEFSKQDDDGREYERFTITAINGDRVQYVESGDNDREWAPASDFLELIIFDQEAVPEKTETISTPYGDIECNVYEVDSRNEIIGGDWEDRMVVWASVDDNVIYKIESYDDWYDGDRWNDWYDDVESYYLTGTSLMSPATEQDPEPVPSTNRFGIELAVGDSFTVTEDNGRDVETYEILAISGNYLTVQETDGGFGKDVERMSADEFLGEFMITSQELQRSWDSTGGTESVNGVECQVYMERYDDDRETICVSQYGENYIVWKETDGREVSILTLNIASIDL